MIQEILPAYGKVLIVDDQYKDVQLIQNILAQNGVPYIFYDYNIIKDIEVRKVEAVRILFLDIRLEDAIQGAKNIASVLTSVIEKLIEPKNGPYAIVLWTNEIALKDEIEVQIKKYIDEKESTCPTYICALDKKDFIAEPEEVLEKELARQLVGQNMMNFLINWENAATSISGNMIRLFLYGLRTKVDNGLIERIFVQMALFENSEVDNKVDATRNILRILVEFLRDRYLEIISHEQLACKLSEYIQFNFTDKDELKKIKKELTIEERASINSILNMNLYDEENSNKLHGKIYVLNDKDITFDLENFHDSTLSSKWYGNNMTIKSEKISLITKLVEIDITPNCDYAQNKNHMLRTVYGYMIVIEKGTEGKWVTTEYSSKIQKKIQFPYVYVTPEFFINDQLCVFAINTKYLTIENHGYNQKYQYLARFNNEIVSEIRKIGADTISRLGINNI